MPVPEINSTVLSRSLMTPRAVSLANAAATLAEVGSTNRPMPREPLRAATISSSVTATDSAAAVFQGVDHFLQPQRMRNGGAFRDRLVDGARDRRIDTGLEARVQRRAVERLGGEQSRQFCYLAGGQQFREADVAAEQVAAGAHGDDDVVGHREVEIFPHLVGDRFGSLQEERLPVVAGVEHLAGLADRLALGFLARPLDQLHLGAVGADLRDFAGDV